MMHRERQVQQGLCSRAGSGLLYASAVLIAGALWMGCAPYAHADSDLSAVLRGLEWGSTKPQVFKHFKEAKMKEFLAESEEVRDGVLKDRKLREKMRQYKLITETFQELKGKRTGYEVSVITGEFEKNKNEALLLERTDIAQKYYFFADGRFWKLAISYDTEYVRGIEFETFVSQVTSKYGEPSESMYSDEGYLQRVVWNDSKTELRIEDKSDFFGTFIMVFSDMSQTKRRERIARLTQENKRKGSKVRDLIQDIQEPTEMNVDEDIVDSIVGVDIKVGLEKTLPKEKIRRVGDEGTPAENVASADELPEETAKKKKKSNWKKRKGRGKGAAAKKGGKGKGKNAGSLNIF